MVAKSEDRIKFEHHQNPYNLTWLAVYARMRQKGESLEEAMSYPAK